ncbi:MAG: FliH/SctL family protein [Terriglobia bacterium]
MPLLSKARLLARAGEPSTPVTRFSYERAPAAAHEPPALSLPLPPGTELIWGGESAMGATSEQEKKRAEEELRALEQQAWQRGFEEAAAQARQNFEKALAAERAGLAAALREFAQGRETYYQQMEGEIIRLVLSISRKVLHREAQVDPMLLTGVVRVALERLAGGTAVKLRVPPIQADAWRATLRSIGSGELALEVVADDSLSGPRCLVVTEMGTTDVSLSAQLAEIENGFLDLLKQRPAAGDGRDRSAGRIP